jgi:hypothetical protein
LGWLSIRITALPVKMEKRGGDYFSVFFLFSFKPDLLRYRMIKNPRTRSIKKWRQGDDYQKSSN